ncbi:MAG: T9SS type A sorting domain-containing protein [Bacteroidetes bacterium]|nr:T9SS type A sorting domain-containing protein [Bacteroidota bacterium]
MAKSYFLLLFIIVFLNLSAQENGGPYTPDNNTVLLMHFENNANNSASVGNNGIIHGSGISYETSLSNHGKCIRIDNSTSSKQSWIEVPFYNDLNFSTGFAIECWFKINSWGQNHTEYPIILRKGDNWPADYEITFSSASNSMQANANCVDDAHPRGTDAGSVQNTLEAGKWYHMAIYFEIQQKHLYLLIRDENYREIFASRGYVPTALFNSNKKLYIGFGNNSNTYFDGWIDELRISKTYRKYRDDVVSAINYAELKDEVQPLLRDKWKVYMDPLRKFFPIDQSTGIIHKGNSCGMTMMTRLVHFWEHPRFPIGQLDFWTDSVHWNVNYDSSDYLYDLMPNTFSANPSIEEYGPSSHLSVEVGTSSKYYHDGMSGMPKALKDYFHYSDSARMIFRDEYSKQEWIDIFKNEISHGRPIMIGGLEERYWNGGAGHFYVCDGYDKNDLFHTDISMGDDEFWIDIDSFPYGMNQDVIIYIFPEWEGKELTLTYPQGGEYLEKKDELIIQWTSSSITNLLLEFSSDSGRTWNKIAENIHASSGSYSWTIPDHASENYKVRLSDMLNPNVYRRSKVFQVYNQKTISFNYPKSNTYFESATEQPIYWQSEGIQAFKLEYYCHSSGWETIADSVLANKGLFVFDCPEIQADEVYLKATDISDNSAVFYSDTFRFMPASLVGGVYKKNNKNILDLHFEENISNAAETTCLPYENQNYGSYAENYDLHLGKAFRIDNSVNSDFHCIRIPHTTELNLGSNWTVESWVKINSLGTKKLEYPILIDKGQSFGIWLDGKGNGFGAQVKFSNNEEISFFQNKQLQLNKWYHVAMVSDSSSGKIKFYVHNDHRKLMFEDFRAFPAGSSGLINHSNHDVFIGGVDGGSNIQFDGWFDELRIGNYAVDFSELVSKTRTAVINNDLRIYPNPVDMNSRVHFKINTTSPVHLSIYNMNGQLISTVIKESLVQGTYYISAASLAGDTAETKIKISVVRSLKLRTA